MSGYVGYSSAKLKRIRICLLSLCQDSKRDYNPINVEQVANNLAYITDQYMEDFDGPFKRIDFYFLLSDYDGKWRLCLRHGVEGIFDGDLVDDRKEAMRGMLEASAREIAPFLDADRQFG